MRQRLNFIKLQIKTEIISKCNKRETDSTNSIQYRQGPGQCTTTAAHYTIISLSGGIRRTMWLANARLSVIWLVINGKTENTAGNSATMEGKCYRFSCKKQLHRNTYWTWKHYLRYTHITITLSLSAYMGVWNVRCRQGYQVPWYAGKDHQTSSSWWSDL